MFLGTFYGLLYFHAYNKLPCMVQQFATLLDFSLVNQTTFFFYIGAGCPNIKEKNGLVHETSSVWLGSQGHTSTIHGIPMAPKKPHFGGYSNKLYISCIAMYVAGS